MMLHSYRILALLLSACGLAAFAEQPPDLPEAISNNAVASALVNGERYLVSFNGIGAGLTHADVHSRTYVYRQGASEWMRAGDVPGGEGRLASVAVGLGEIVYLFGGYSVAPNGDEKSLPETFSFDARRARFKRKADMPIPVDDAVAVVYQDRFVYLVSGWHDIGNVNLVQRYDTKEDVWEQATPWPGAPVFGHAGAALNGTMIICDGVGVDNNALPRRFIATHSCYKGRVDGADGRRIHWQKIPPHPGGACYRMTAAALPRQGLIVFSGGADNPYNFNGIGYDGRPARVCQQSFAYDVNARRWVRGEVDAGARMDQRGMIVAGDTLLGIAGMTSERSLEAGVRELRFIAAQ